MFTISAYDNKLLLSPHTTRDYYYLLILKTSHRKVNTEILARVLFGKTQKKTFCGIDIGDLDKIILICA